MCKSQRINRVWGATNPNIQTNRILFVFLLYMSNKRFTLNMCIVYFSMLMVVWNNSRIEVITYKIFFDNYLWYAFRMHIQTPDRSWRRASNHGDFGHGRTGNILWEERIDTLFSLLTSPTFYWCCCCWAGLFCELLMHNCGYYAPVDAWRK